MITTQAFWNINSMVQEKIDNVYKSDSSVRGVNHIQLVGFRLAIYLIGIAIISGSDNFDLFNSIRDNPINYFFQILSFKRRHYRTYFFNLTYILLLSTYTYSKS